MIAAQAKIKADSDFTSLWSADKSASGRQANEGALANDETLANQPKEKGEQKEKEEEGQNEEEEEEEEEDEEEASFRLLEARLSPAIEMTRGASTTTVTINLDTLPATSVGGKFTARDNWLLLPRGWDLTGWTICLRPGRVKLFSRKKKIKQGKKKERWACACLRGR